MDIVYDPSLTLAKIKSEIEHRVSTQNIKLVVVDYINQVKRASIPSRQGQYDWTEQIEVSKALKQYAQDYEVLIFSPYQTDATGEARFAKGILDAADAAFALETWTPSDRCITFDCKKMRNGPMEDFTSVMEWDTLKIGPHSAMNPKEKASIREQMSTEEVNEL
jgi:replicative DNA helicase